MDFVRSNERTPDSKAGSVLTRDKTRPTDRLCSDNSVVLKKTREIGDRRRNSFQR